MERDDQRRRQILAAAEQLLRHYGPAKTTVAEIAREAHLGVGTVYLEFSSKDEISAELSRRRYVAILQGMQAAAAGTSASYAARLRAVFDAKVEFLLRLAGEGVHAPDLVHCGH